MTSTYSDRIHLANVDDLPDPGARGFDPYEEGCDTLFVVRCGAQVRAYRDACPHFFGVTQMAWRKDAYLNGDGTRIVCHAHGAQFDIASGECVLGPCLGQRLTSVEIDVTDDGAIMLTAT
ncbi:Rieske (2Fe-2S) protein [Burkholderia plantarii]|uniref:Rieske (2Fe-2S) protein n=1 Tax=Burkholderia plantarii TaxID=41899 RepID=UPI0006D8B74D|nr:Rieske 2Fe-2S domain-containing protein [Burkholderia plantarii]ALK33556.1 Rieske (2Fe-2S) domain-containing protein [Burkholderia plantarii]GLZ23203.1 (2Fe-2S)-binding protein [Burkholderia plantarii]